MCLKIQQKKKNEHDWGYANPYHSCIKQTKPVTKHIFNINGKDCSASTCLRLLCIHIIAPGVVLFCSDSEPRTVCTSIWIQFPGKKAWTDQLNINILQWHLDEEGKCTDKSLVSISKKAPRNTWLKRKSVALDSHCAQANTQNSKWRPTA